MRFRKLYSKQKEVATNETSSQIRSHPRPPNRMNKIMRSRFLIELTKGIREGAVNLMSRRVF